MVRKQSSPRKATRPKSARRTKRQPEISAALESLNQIESATDEGQKVISLLKSWLADESGYDEEAWPQLRKMLDLERQRTGSRSLFDG